MKKFTLKRGMAKHVKDCIAHWKRMLAAAKRGDLHDCADTPCGEECALCKNTADCGECPLWEHYGGCTSSDDNPYREAYFAWGKGDNKLFARAATHMVKCLISLLPAKKKAKKVKK
jgi:hypothetical protein